MKLILSGFLVAACLAGAALHAESYDALYLLAGGDAKILANQDANNYFGPQAPKRGTQGYGDAVAHLGWQIQNWAAIEASFNLGPFRQYELVNYTDGRGFGASQVSTNWTLYTYSITPGLTWVSPRFVNFLGIRGGIAHLDGKVVNNYAGAIGNGSYDQEANTPDIGVVFRTSTLFCRHLSIGFEVGWDYTVFNNVNNSNGTGTYSGNNGTSHNNTASGQPGAQTSLNFSGPHLGMTIGLWSNAPVVKDSDESVPVSATQAQ